MPAEKLLEKKIKLNAQGRKIHVLSDTAFGYLSKGDPRARLNGEFQSQDNMRIACRHLAAAWAFVTWQAQPDSYHELFKNQNEISFLDKNSFDTDELLFRMENYLLFNINNIGEELHDISQNLIKGQEISILFGSANHLMAMIIKCEADDGFKLKFYDPNNTLVHRQFILENIEAMALLKIDDFIRVEERIRYFNKINDSGIFAFNYTKTPGFSSYKIGGNVSSVDKPIFGMIYNALPWIDNFVSCKNHDGYSILFMAVSCGHSSRFKFLIDKTFESPSTSEEKFNFLLNRGFTGPSILYVALNNNHHQIVNVYMQKILSSNFSSDNKMTLLTAQDNNERFGLLMALRKGHYQAIAIYLRLVLRSNLSDAQKKNLLLISHGLDVNAAFNTAHANNQDQAIAIYRHHIYSADFSFKDKCKLLQLKNIDLNNNILVKACPFAKKQEVRELLITYINKRDQDLNEYKSIFGCMLGHSKTTKLAAAKIFLKKLDNAEDKTVLTKSMLNALTEGELGHIYNVLIDSKIDDKHLASSKGPGQS